MLWLVRVAFCEQRACMLSKKRLLSDLKPPEVRSNTCTWKIFQGECKWKWQFPLLPSGAGEGMRTECGWHYLISVSATES